MTNEQMIEKMRRPPTACQTCRRLQDKLTRNEADALKFASDVSMLTRRIAAYPHKAVEFTGHLHRLAVERGAPDPSVLRDAPPQLTGWQDISTAPTHDRILLFYPPVEGHRIQPTVLIAFSGWDSDNELPTHWMPLPAPPPTGADR